MTDGNKIRDQRLKAGLTQEKAAMLFDVSIRTYANWEASNKMRDYKLEGIKKLLEESADVK